MAGYRFPIEVEITGPDGKTFRWSGAGTPDPSDIFLTERTAAACMRYLAGEVEADRPTTVITPAAADDAGA